MTDLEAAYARITDAIGDTNHVGQVVVHAQDFQRFAYACGHADQRFLDGTSPVAPPLYLSAVLGWGAGPAQDALRSDGSDPAATSGLPLEGLRLMGAGQDIEYHSEVRDGMVLDVTVAVESAEAKQGRQGALIVLTLRRTFSADTSPVMTCRERVIAR